ncbi:MAG: FAD-binding protein, partial [Planctomycetota bacterium]
MTTSSTTWPCAAVPQAELAGRTTMRVGGQAEWLLEPADPGELRAAWQAAKDRGLPVRLLGGGANLVIEDGVHAGVTIATERMRRVFRPLDEADGAPLESDAALTEPRALVAHDRTRDPRLVAWCGASLPGLSRAASQLGWSGLEGLAGVPGSVGGGLAMNAGGRWGEMWDHVTEAMLLDEEGELTFVTKDSVQPGYRDGRLGERIAVGCVFKLDVEHPQVV